jgi:excisionase family DNA binding protein
MQTIKNKEYYSVAEVAGILGLSRIAVFNRIKKGRIKAIRIGRSYAIPAAALEFLLGRALRESEKRDIEDAVKRTVKEYGEVLEKLGKE